MYSIHVASAETMAFTIIISGSAIFSAGLRSFYTRHSRLIANPGHNLTEMYIVIFGLKTYLHVLGEHNGTKTEFY